jgi:hypothetical protein
MAVDIVTRAVDTKCERVNPSSRTWHGVPIRYLTDGSMLFRSIGSCEYFPQASHTVLIERRTRLAAGTSAMKYTRTKNQQEIKKQEIKNLKTICISENDNATAKENQFHFFSDGICPASHFKIYCAQKIEADATQSR